MGTIQLLASLGTRAGKVQEAINGSTPLHQAAAAGQAQATQALLELPIEVGINAALEDFDGKKYSGFATTLKTKHDP